MSGAAGDATSGATIEIYWDTAIGDNAQLLNSTTAKADGDYEVQFKVPEAITGNHFVWVKDTSGPFYETSTAFIVDPLVKLSPSSGLKGDDIDVNGYGFGDEVLIGIEIDPWNVGTETIGTGDGSIKTFSGTLDYFPIVPNTVIMTDIGVIETITDDGLGGLSSLLGGTGTINYLTGVFSVTFFAAPGVGPVLATYNRDLFAIETSTTFKTDDLGSFTKTFDIPDFPYGTYQISVASSQIPVIPLTLAPLKIGASISVSPDEGPTGTKVTVEGRGWTSGNTITFRDKAAPLVAIEVVDGDIITVGSGGTFSADVVIPVLGTEGDYDIEAVETLVAPNTATKSPSSDGFELTGLPKVVVSPTYGIPGSTITVTGSNFTQVAGTDVVIELWGKAPVVKIADLVIAETESDGTFEDTFISPAVTFTSYDVIAVDEYDIDEDDAYKVGLIALIITPDHGEAGTKISITGIGFKPLSSYNVTFGTKLYEDYGTVTSGEAISAPFYIPNVELGTHDMNIIDEDENELTVQFEVTAVTEVDLDPAKAPSTYNVTIEGFNFADKDAEEVEFVIYNSTMEEPMDVWQNGAGDDPVETGADGNFTAWWEVLDEDILSLGDYTINVTGYDDFLLQIPFSVVEARVSVAPRKALFDRGDTIQFTVKNDFDFEDSYMKIWDPYDNLYWRTEVFEDWLKVGDIYTVPFYLQTSGMNPMTLSQDAPLGTWFYVFYEEGTTQLTNGTFVVGPSSSAQVEEKLSEIWASMEGITENIDSITDEISDDIADLSGEIDDVVADVQDMIDDITTDIAADLAKVASDTEAAVSDAVSDIEADIGDIADAQNQLASEIDAMGQDTAAAREAAEDAQGATQGLTGIVYGAIGCSLIAALAAIVSLMQISKKIA